LQGSNLWRGEGAVAILCGKFEPNADMQPMLTIEAPQRPRTMAAMRSSMSFRA
jgi:hypothetical protein